MIKEFTKNGMYWLTSVKGAKDDPRFHIKYFMVKDNVAVKTDGNRLHVLFDVPLADGFYEVISRTKSLVKVVLAEEYSKDMWPDWERIFPEHKDFEEIPINTGISCFHRAAAQIIRFLKENYVNLDFIKDLIDTESWFNLINYKSIDPDNGPLIFASDNQLAAIMPMRA